jgi:8-oxo-dGTP diphosphatase
MNFIEGVSAALVSDGKILVVRRSSDDDFLAGYYEMPGGKVELGESHEQAVIREIHEELSLNVKPIKKYHEFSYQPGPNTHCIDYQYLVALEQGEDIKNLKLSNEHNRYLLLKKEEIDNLSPITDEAKESIKLAFAQM